MKKNNKNSELSYILEHLTLSEKKLLLNELVKYKLLKEIPVGGALKAGAGALKMGGSFAKKAGKFIGTTILPFTAADMVLSRPTEKFWDMALGPRPEDINALLQQNNPENAGVAATGNIGGGMPLSRKAAIGAGATGLGLLGYYLYKRRKQKQFEQMKKKMQQEKIKAIMSQKKIGEEGEENIQ